MTSTFKCLAGLTADLRHIALNSPRELFYYLGNEGEFLRVRYVGENLYELFSWSNLGDKIISYGNDLLPDDVALRANTMIARRVVSSNVEPGRGFTDPRQPFIVPDEESEELFQLLKGRLQRGEKPMQPGDSFEVDAFLFAMDRVKKYVEGTVQARVKELMQPSR